MNESEIKTLWAQYETQLENVLSYNRKIAEELTKQKAKNMLSEARPIKYVGIILGFPWLLFLIFLVFVGFQSRAWVFMVSFAVIALVTVVALGTYIYHLVLITRINLSDSVLDVQKKLANIKTSTIISTRIAVLQLPFWTTWYLQPRLLFDGDMGYILVNMVITGLFVYVSIWLFRNIRRTNMDQKWMKFFFSDVEWEAVVQAMNILDEIEEFKEDSKSPSPL